MCVCVCVCEKQQIKLFSSKTFLVNKLNQKVSRKMLSQVDLIRLIKPELSRAKAKNSYTLNVDNFLNMTVISLQVLTSHITSTHLHLPTIFFQSFIFFATSPLLRKCFSYFSFRASLNCKVAC